MTSDDERDEVTPLLRHGGSLGDVLLAGDVTYHLPALREHASVAQVGLPRLEPEIERRERRGVVHSP